MNKNGHNTLLNYIDDLIYYGLPSSIHQSYEFLLSLLADLGLDISVNKLQPPDTKVVCLVILFDTVNCTISIPDEKLAEVIHMCQVWTDKSVCNKRELQSLLGLLLYISKCVKPARIFLNRMLQFLRHFHTTNASYLPLTTEFRKDLHWFRTFLKSHNGITIYDIRPTSYQVHLDASLSGLGGIYNDLVYALHIPRGYKEYDIVHLEMINVIVALKLWGHI